MFNINTSFSVDESTHTQLLNKFLCVGYGNQISANIRDIMIELGVAPATNLARDNIKPEDITNIIKDGKGIEHSYTKPISVDKIWNFLAEELVMANYKSKLWCWSDQAAISLLDYWASVDSKVGFVLAFSSPYTLMRNLFSEDTSLSSDKVSKIMSEWIAYNRSLLDFYYNNMQRCILVGYDGVVSNTTQFSTVLVERFAIDLKQVNIDVSRFEVSRDPVLEYFVDKIVSKSDDLINLYEELQSSASVVVAQSSGVSYVDVLAEYVSQKTDTLEYLTELQNSLRDNELQLDKLEQEKASLLKAMKEQEQLVASLNKDKSALVVDTKAKQEQLAKLSKENESMLNNLFAVQEELEKYLSDHRDMLKENDLLRDVIVSFVG